MGKPLLYFKSAGLLVDFEGKADTKGRH